MKLVVNSPEELVAAIPHVLGFQPADSMVVVPLTQGLPTARLDLPKAGELEAFLDALTGPYARHATTGSAVAVVCFTDNQAQAETVSQELAQRFEFVGITTPLRLSADSEHWADLNTGDGGIRSEQAALRVASEAVLAGVPQPATTRDVLAASLIGDREPVANLLSAAQTTPTGMTEAELADHATTERTWAMDRCRQFESDGVRLTDADSARLLMAMSSTPTRDELWNAMTADNAASHVDLWSDMVRRAPDDVRAAPAALCGFASWLHGDGARAWCALDQIPADQNYPLASVVATVLQEGVNPREWAEVKGFMHGLTTGLDETLSTPGPDPLATSARHPDELGPGLNTRPERGAPGR